MKLFSPKLNLSCLLILCASLLISCTDFATDDRKSVQLILKKDDKTYLFSRLGTMITNNKLDKNESPTTVQSTSIVVKENQLYTEPQHIKSIANLISGNYVIHDHQEKIFDGYISDGKHKVYNKKYVNEHSEKFGEMISIANIYLTDTDQTRKYHISWQRSPNQIPITNCIEMALWVDKSYKPGERTTARDNFIMINLNDLVEFYNSNVKLDYVEEDKVLYFIVD
ncbi:hypothetical protein BXY75_1660 [Ulvibacter antarcticus]|uniref:Lipoprotein n=2 Tax=Ulvibacter antarcticus TaxID=442714 RepID=A0A3L9Z084_9FLAO|nr:hypothetical protein BXY75_1660 [Ulvibacter antarcticus]